MSFSFLFWLLLCLSLYWRDLYVVGYLEFLPFVYNDFKIILLLTIICHGAEHIAGLDILS